MGLYLNSKMTNFSYLEKLEQSIDNKYIGIDKLSCIICEQFLSVLGFVSKGQSGHTGYIKRNKLNIPPLTPEKQVQVYEKFNTFLINILRPSNDINNDSNIREIDACRKMVIEDKVPEEICYLSQFFMDDREYVLIREIRDQFLILKEQINIRC
jgi:hypothetical protein